MSDNITKIEESLKLTYIKSFDDKIIYARLMSVLNEKINESNTVIEKDIDPFLMIDIHYKQLKNTLLNIIAEQFHFKMSKNVDISVNNMLSDFYQEILNRIANIDKNNLISNENCMKFLSYIITQYISIKKKDAANTFYKQIESKINTLFKKPHMRTSVLIENDEPTLIELHEIIMSILLADEFYRLQELDILNGKLLNVLNTISCMIISTILMPTNDKDNTYMEKLHKYIIFILNMKIEDIISIRDNIETPTNNEPKDIFIFIFNKIEEKI